MIAINLVFGTLFIGLGFIIGKKPEIISKLNLLAEDQKEKVDLNVFVPVVKWTFIITGLTVIIGSTISYWLNWPLGLMLSIFIPIIIMALLLNIEGRKLEFKKVPEKNKEKALAVIFVIVALSIAIFIIFSRG